MHSLVYLTAKLPSQVSNDLQAAGCQVFEAFEISEVWFLCEHETIDVVVIAPDIEDQDQTVIQLRQPTIKMKPETNATDILWELSNLLPTPKPQIIQ